MESPLVMTRSSAGHNKDLSPAMMRLWSCSADVDWHAFVAFTLLCCRLTCICCFRLSSTHITLDPLHFIFSASARCRSSRAFTFETLQPLSGRDRSRLSVDFPVLSFVLIVTFGQMFDFILEFEGLFWFWSMNVDFTIIFLEFEFWLSVNLPPYFYWFWLKYFFFWQNKC